MSTRTLLIALVVALLAAMPAHAARQALVIGNAAYTEGAPEFDTNSYKRMICIGCDLQRTTTASSTGCLGSVFSASVPRTRRLVLD